MPDLRDSLQTTLGNSYTLESELGGGGMSRVFVAREEALGRQVVVKVLPPEMAAAVSAERFRREIQLAAQLQHPHIVPLLTAGETQGLPYFTMPFVRGENLRARLSKQGELPVGEAMRLLRDVACALEYAHEHGVVHRDIKPENVLLSGGSAVVTDFGVAKALTASSGEAHTGVTSVGVALGTPAYMSPEQACADPAVDHRTDIYAFGVLGYELLTGSTPFPGRTPQSVLAAHVSEIPESISRRRASIPPGLASLIMQCLEKHASDRPQTAQEIVARIDGLTTPSGGLEPTTAVAAVSSRSSAAPLWLKIAGGVSIAALIAFIAIRATRNATPALAAVPRIAVLPFENGGRAEDAYIAEGISEAITNRLASVSGMNVIGRQSVKRYAGTDKTPEQIGHELGVSHLLTGTVRWDRSATGPVQVSVRPALIRVSDGAAVWSQAYDTVFGGVFKLESQVAERVAQALNVALLQSEKSAIDRTPTTSLAAYDEYMRGRATVSTRTAEGLASASAHLRKALELDPKFARAYAALAEVYALLDDYAGASSDSTNRIASEYAMRAITLDSSLGSPHATLADIASNTGKMADANAEFLTSIRLEPGYATTHHWYSRFLMGAGRTSEALREAERASVLDPLSPIINGNVGMMQMYARRYAEAERTMREVIAREPKFIVAHWGLAEILKAAGRPREAIAEMDIALDLSRTRPTGARVERVEALALAGNTGEARAELAALKRRKDADRNMYVIARAHFALNERDSAFSWLGRLGPKLRGHRLVLRHPILDPVANDPRMIELMKQAFNEP